MKVVAAEWRKANWQLVKAKNTWKGMISRCHDPDHGRGCPPGIPRYADYGAKGVKVSKRWRGTGGFDRFVADLGLPPHQSFTLDRRNPRRGYMPKNCCWVHPETQKANRKNSRWIVADVDGRDVVKNLSEWSRHSGIGRSTIARRLNAGWEPARAVTELPNDAVPF